MDRHVYMKIRKSQALQRRRFALAWYYVQDVAALLGIAAFAVHFQHSLLRVALIPAIAALIFRNFSMMHEAVHGAAAKNKRLNQCVGWLAGGICLLAFEPWKHSHLEHHLWSGNTERDPVTAIITVFPKMPVGTRKTISFFWRIWFPILAVIQYVVFWALAAQILRQPKTRSVSMMVSVLCPLTLWGLVFSLCTPTFSLSVLVPAILVYLVGVEVVNFPHHLQLPQYRGNTRFPIWEQHRIARSCLYPKWFARHVVLNFNYHIEHHMFPDVSWYHLESLQGEVSKALAHSYNIDPSFRWILDNKRRSMGEVLKAADDPEAAVEAA